MQLCSFGWLAPISRYPLPGPFGAPGMYICVHSLLCFSHIAPGIGKTTFGAYAVKVRVVFSTNVSPKTLADIFLLIKHILESEDVRNKFYARHAEDVPKVHRTRSGKSRVPSEQEKLDQTKNERKFIAMLDDIHKHLLYVGLNLKSENGLPTSDATAVSFLIKRFCSYIRPSTVCMYFYISRTIPFSLDQLLSVLQIPTAIFLLKNPCGNGFRSKKETTYPLPLQIRSHTYAFVCWAQILHSWMAYLLWFSLTKSMASKIKRQWLA